MDEEDGSGGSALDQWYSRSPQDIDQERRDAEQAGRDAYAEAIRTGEDVQARTPDELIQLGRTRLAQQGGGMLGSGDDQPLVNPNDNYQVAGPAVARAQYPHHLDPIIERKVAEFNKMNQADPGDDIYLDPDLVKAQIMVESGHDLKAYNSDPMQVNKSTDDWDANPKTGDPGHKITLGLQKGVPPGPELGIGAGLGWLDAKSYFHDGTGAPGPFIGYEQAFKRYNGGGNPTYWGDVQNAYRYIKSGGR